jgi:hypothetical protein
MADFHQDGGWWAPTSGGWPNLPCAQARMEPCEVFPTQEIGEMVATVVREAVFVV